MGLEADLFLSSFCSFTSRFLFYFISRTHPNNETTSNPDDAPTVTLKLQQLHYYCHYYRYHYHQRKKELGIRHSHASGLFHLFRGIRRLSRRDESDEEIKDESRGGW